MAESSKITIVKRTVAVKLSDTEIADCAREAAEHAAQAELKKFERVALNKVLKKLEQTRDELLQRVERGTEDRELECSRVPDFSKNVWRIYRPDTGELVEEYAMTAADHQLALDEVDRVASESASYDGASGDDETYAAEPVTVIEGGIQLVRVSPNTHAFADDNGDYEPHDFDEDLDLDEVMGEDLNDLRLPPPRSPAGEEDDDYDTRYDDSHDDEQSEASADGESEDDSDLPTVEQGPKRRGRPKGAKDSKPRKSRSDSAASVN